MPCRLGRFRLPSPDTFVSGSCSLERCRLLQSAGLLRARSLRRPPAVSRSRPRILRSAAVPARAPSWGFRLSLFATSASDVHWLVRAPSSNLTVHPRRFARPRWFAPSPALRACFIPLPRAGFPFREFVPRCEPYRVSPARCPLSVQTSPTAPAPCGTDAPSKTPSDSGLFSHIESGVCRVR